jgi:hypothetical protein
MYITDYNERISLCGDDGPKHRKRVKRRGLLCALRNRMKEAPLSLKNGVKPW